MCEINSLDISIALPNNLVGHVPITAVSRVLTQKIEASTAADATEGDITGDETDLEELFSLGQYLRVAVTSTMEDATTSRGKPRRRIELATTPELTNAGLSEGDIIGNCTVMASVASVEDHGFVMDLGIVGSTIRGFLARKELDSAIPADRLRPGAILLCLALSKSANGKVVQLSTLPKKLGNVERFPSSAKTVNTFLPGTAVEVLVSESSPRGIVGKVLGHLDVTADVTHSGAGPDGVDVEGKYGVGSKIRARVICTFPTAQKSKLGVSTLEHISHLQSRVLRGEDGQSKTPLDILPLSAIVERCVVLKAEPDMGLWVDVGVDGARGFVHISRVEDGKVDALYASSGRYKVGSAHRGRVIGYNSIDGGFLVSFEPHILAQPYLRVEDIPVGEVVNGVIEKLIINENGVAGLIVKLADGITGLVPETHLADVQLQHPEKRFKEGMKVKARVLSTDPRRHQLRLTLKKALVNSETPPLRSFSDVAVGLQTLGSIINILPSGAVVQFYGPMRGFLPISEMSEAYIRDPKEHFRVGQVVAVHVLNFDPEANKLVVSCKDPSAWGLEKQAALRELKLGHIVSAEVIEKTDDDVFVDLVESSLRARLPIGHLTDKSVNKNRAALRKIHAGQVLTDLLVLDKHEGRRTLTLSQKPSLIKASKESQLLTRVEDAKPGLLVPGFVRNITATAAFIQFAGNVTALLPKSLIPPDARGETDFGLHRFQSVLVRIVSVDSGRLVVAIPSVTEPTPSETITNVPLQSKGALTAAGESAERLGGLTTGEITKARVTAVKDTQLNVELAGGIQGRIDISEVFDTWDEISNPKAPLQGFYENQIVKVRVLGIHDARKHTYLPISHRSSHPVLELSAKPSSVRGDSSLETLSMDSIQVGTNWLGFVNNHGPGCLWVNLSPIIRGRLRAMEASDDLSQINELEGKFPVGCAMRVRVIAVDANHRRLDLSARLPTSVESITWDTIKQNMVLPGKVTKVNERQVLVQLSKSVSGPVHLVDLGDNYDDATTALYSKNDIIRVSVVEVDNKNKRLRLSTRPSRVLNSSLPVEDPEVVQATSIEPARIIRGFVKNISDKGVFVNLGGDATAFVRISDLSDNYLKEWQKHFQIDQLVKGRVISVQHDVHHIQMSLKASVLRDGHAPLLTLADLREGQTVTGKIRKVEEFGAFIVIDNSANISGLCHRSEMAEDAVKDARKLYKEGDIVKAKILAVDITKKRVNLGLKPSYFDRDSDNGSEDDDDDDDDMDDGEASGAILLSDDGSENLDTLVARSDDAVMVADVDATDEDDGDNDVAMIDGNRSPPTGLGAGGFDWSGGALDALDAESDVYPETETPVTAPRKKRGGQVVDMVDRTGSLDRHGPQTASDYERLLLGQPDSSALWIAYMAFHMQVSELSKAREIAERGIKTINVREETEKLNVWIAYLNLEIVYGSDETVEDVFGRACQYNDEQDVHERVASIYIQSEKMDVS